MEKTDFHSTDTQTHSPKATLPPTGQTVPYFNVSRAVITLLIGLYLRSNAIPVQRQIITPIDRNLW